MDMVKTFSLCLALGAASPLAAQNISRTEYIDRYSGIAVEHAEKYGIPASIKMAQGILESGNGNGTLARSGNAHFNIKVKASDNWRGAVVYHDDDRPNEAFRAYDTPEESWLDHSVYLDTQPRYDSLFRYEVTDYRSWARGLKNAGYATDPLYAEKLIRIIEDNRLWLLDRGEKAPAAATVTRDRTATPPGIASGSASGQIDIDRFTVAMNHAGGRDIVRTPEGRTVISLEGDTLRKISEATGVRLRRLARLNRLDRNAVLSAGQQIRIE